MLQPPVCIDARLSPGEGRRVDEKLIRTSMRRMNIEEQAEIARQAMPVFRVYQKGTC